MKRFHYKNKELERRIEEFRNRPIYEDLSLEILATIPDDKVEQAIIDYIHTKILDYDKAFAIVSNLSDGFQLIYSTWILAGEVGNGGFNQFFFNPSGQFADMALRSLKLIGATEYFNILQKAIEIHEREKENSVLQDLYSQQTIPSFFKTYEYTSLTDCDDAFSILDNRLSELRIHYIRSNPELFVVS